MDANIGEANPCDTVCRRSGEEEKEGGSLSWQGGALSKNGTKQKGGFKTVSKNPGEERRKVR